MKVYSKNWIAILVALTSLLYTSQALAALHLSLGGSRSESNAGYQKIESGAGSAGLSIDLGEYFRIGYTHRQELSSTTGYQQIEDTTEYQYFKSLSHVKTNAVDLTLVLYAGDIVTPYIFAGVAVKSYRIASQKADGTTESSAGTYPGPQGGAGLGIRLNQKFSLKLTYTMTQGVRQLPGKIAEGTIDSYTQVGISYAL